MLRLSWLISLGISLMGFLLIGQLFTMKPQDNSGNFGFIGVVFVMPFLILSLFTTFRYFLTLSRNSRDHMLRAVSIVGGVLLIGVFVYFSIDFQQNVLSTLGETTTDPNLPLLNEYTHKIFFNFYTFGLIHTILGVLGAIIGLARPRNTMGE
ncbi:nucleoside-diphosphate sugar epimerase [Lysinibacillus telephonicus]|uniref:nucleoside-diphosphate sugar epimerase n=2 Tax=Lysinibacillus telephonicus TaxID=1714840 RepID=UPI00397CD6EC